MGHFELIVLSEGRRSGRRGSDRFDLEGGRPCGQTGFRIEQSVIWAESRRISISGELDRTGADALQRLLAGTIGSGLPCVVLDLANCEFLDAGALAVILGFELQLAARGQELVVAGATGQVRRLIDLARAISPRVCLPSPQRTARD